MKEQNDDFVCEQTVVHEDAIERARNGMRPDDLICDVAELFKVLGDTTRARIICALMAEELCVCDIATLLSMTSSAISHQLRILKQAHVVRSRRDGKTIYYSLADEHIAEIYGVAFTHVAEEVGE